MRISKKVAGISTLLLAVVGAFATATHQRDNTYYYISASGTHPCKATTVTFDCVPGVSGCTKVVGTGTTAKQLYHTQVSSATCRNPLELA